MVVLGRWRATGEELYREVARTIEAAPGKDILVAGCGEGVTTEWLAARTGAAITGVDPDAERIERAEARARAATAPLPISYQQAPLDDLPHETGSSTPRSASRKSRRSPTRSARWRSWCG
jgi:2-polyprenyl-3-methyl-5-hydroxy-6-metoxy-1,4-benzoquinol methylase